MTLFVIACHRHYRLLPQAFYEDTDALTEFLKSDGLFALWQSFMRNNGFDVVYNEKDFSVQVFPQEEGTEVILLTMPKPEDASLCSRIYLCRNAVTGEMDYCTVEYDNFFGESWFLCGWTKDHNHVNYSTIPALPEPEDPSYADALAAEIERILGLMH